MNDEPGSAPGNDNEIGMFLHCGLCLEEKPDGVSPREWAQIEAGWTQIGLQIWCRRHEANICHIDFEGHQHPANTSRRRQRQH
jgi:hypothetical protein